MGEAWSDWYAEDYLAGAGLQTDTAAPGEIRSSTYVNAAIRTQPFDCPVASGPPACPGFGGAGPGGYTYGDFGEILGFAEVHADGEIWVETLWDLRQALIGAHGGPGGVSRVRTLVTDGMRLAPDYPTFLQARDAILQADVLRGFGDRDRIWAVFAARGMGVNARTTGDGDTNPIQDFTTPPPLPPEDRTRPGVSRFTLSNVRFLVGLDRTPRAAQRRRRRPHRHDLPLPPLRGRQGGGDAGARPAGPQGGPELPQAQPAEQEPQALHPLQEGRRAHTQPQRRLEPHPLQRPPRPAAPEPRHPPRERGGHGRRRQQVAHEARALRDRRARVAREPRKVIRNASI